MFDMGPGEFKQRGSYFLDFHRFKCCIPLFARPKVKRKFLMKEADDHHKNYVVFVFLQFSNQHIQMFKQTQQACHVVSITAIGFLYF